MKIFDPKKIKETLYLLNENLKEGFYITATLVIGKEKAAIIGTGYGAGGDLRDVVESITDKPVICLLTHCDPDHSGQRSSVRGS